MTGEIKYFIQITGKMKYVLYAILLLLALNAWMLWKVYNKPEPIVEFTMDIPIMRELVKEILDGGKDISFEKGQKREQWHNNEFQTQKSETKNK
jgi:hypothetical protein